MVTPESIAGVSENMVAVATASFLLGMLNAGTLDLKCYLIWNRVAVTAHWVEFSKVFLMVSALIQPK